MLVVPAELRDGKLVAVTRRPETAAVFDKPPYALKRWTDILDGDRCQRIPPDGTPAYCVTPGVQYRTRREWRDWVLFFTGKTKKERDVADLRILVEESVARINAMEILAAKEALEFLAVVPVAWQSFVMGIRQGIGDLIDLLLANLANIDETELKVILAKLEETAMDLARGAWIAAAVSLFAAWRFYRLAIKTVPIPGPVIA